jgi:D-glycero-D-manno-heptose 1,7-bisphosphate phosphatase
MRGSRRAVFLDRDGTVSEEVGYMREPSRFALFAWTGRSIRRINEAGLAAVLVTNQSGVGRGYFDSARVDEVHHALEDEIAKQQARLDGIYYCPHHPEEGCECRKPGPGMLHRASRDLDIELTRSFMVGDRYTDILAGRSVGARTILVLSGAGKGQQEEHRNAPVQPDHVVATLEDAVDLILDRLSGLSQRETDPPDEDRPDTFPTTEGR